MMIQRTNGDDGEKFSSYSRLVVSGVALVSFGVAYAGLVNKLERSGHMENRSSWYVALGTLVTLVVRCLFMPIGETRLALLAYTVVAFGFSGVPMMVNQMLTKTRVDTGFVSRLKDREWIVSKNGPVTEPR